MIIWDGSENELEMENEIVWAFRDQGQEKSLLD